MDSYTRIKGLGLDLLVYQDPFEMGIRQTPRTPFIWFTKEGELSISGRLVPEHSREFLHILEKWIEDAGARNNRDIKIIVDLDFITAQGSRFLYQLLSSLKVGDRNLEVDWSYQVDEPYMLELGQILAELLDTNFYYFLVDRKPDPLDYQYRKCLVDRDSLLARIQTGIRQINESGNYLNLSWFDITESLVNQIKGKYHRKRISEIITMKAKFLELNKLLDQYRLSIMQRDLREGRELNDDIRTWWGKRY